MALRAILAVLSCLVGALAEPTEPPSQIALTHITIIDVRDGSTRSDMTVVISNGRIARVGSSADTPLPKQLRVIDGRGKFLIPGLWDMHVHTDGDERVLRLFLDFGITGVRDMAGDVKKLAEVRRRINAGELEGPRLRFAGPRLNGPPAEPDSDVWVIHSPDEARRAVNSLADLHVDFIKVHDGLTKDSFMAIAETAKARGLTFVGHVPASVTPMEASDMGQKSIEHFEFLPKPCLALLDSTSRAEHHIPAMCDEESLNRLFHEFVKNGTWLDPTIQSFRYWAPNQWDAIFAGFREIAGQIRKNQVQILAGTDWSTSPQQKDAAPGETLHDELALLVDAGFTPLEALRAATWNPALFFGVSDSFGTVESGKVADLVVLDGNPLQDIHNTKRIAIVIWGGEVLEGEKLRSMQRPH